MLIQVAAITLALPPVQNRLVVWVKNYFSEQLGIRAEMKGVNIALPVKAVLTDLKVYSSEDELFAELGALKMNVLDFELWDYLFASEADYAISLGSLDLIEPVFHLYRRSDSTMNTDFLKGDGAVEDAAPNEKQLAINIPGIHLEGGVFTYTDSAAPEVDSFFVNRINYSRISLADISGDFSFYSRPSGSVEASTSNLGFREVNSGFEVTRLSTEIFKQTIRLNDPESPFETVSILEFRDMYLEVFDSRIAADVRFSSQDLSTLLDKVPDEQFDVLLKSSQLGFSTLSYLFKKPLPLAGNFQAKGMFSGTLDHIRSNSLDLTYLENTHFQGQLALRDYTDPDSMLMNLKLAESTFSFGELQQLLPEVEIPPALVRLKPITLEGSYLGTYYDFRTDANAETEGGGLSWNLHLMLPSHFEEFAYEGGFETTDLNIDLLGLAKSPISDQASFSGRIKGKGTNLNTLTADVSGKILNSRLLSHRLDSLQIDGLVSNGGLTGDVHLSDPQGYMDMNIRAEFAQTIPEYTLSGQLRNLDLAAYGYGAKLPLRISSDLSASFSGDSLEKINGEVDLRKVVLKKKENEEELEIPRIWLQSFNNTRDKKYINIKSSVLDADLTGTFAFGKVGKVVQNLFYETALFFTNQDSLIEAHYATKTIDSTSLSLKFALAPHDTLNHLAQFLGYPLTVSANSLLTGKIESGPFELVEFRSEIDSIQYDNLRLAGVDMDLELIKASDRNMVISAGGLKVDSLRSGDRLLLENIALGLGNVSGSDNTIQLDILADQVAQRNRLQLVLEANLLERGGLSASFDEKASYIKIRQDTLRIRAGNRAIYDEESLTIRGLRFENGERYLLVRGGVSKDPTSVLTLDFQKIRLELIDRLYPLQYKPGGILNASVRLSGLLDRLVMETNGEIIGFSVDDFDYGNVYLNSAWNPEVERMNLNARLLGTDSDTTLRMVGYYLGGEVASPLNFDITTEKSFPLNYISPFVKTQLFGIQGRVELRSFRVEGSFEDLVVKGTGQFVDAGFGVEYFQTEYRFNGLIEFDTDRIVFPQRSPIRLYDKNRNHADFYGVIRHRGMREFDFDLQLDRVKDFLVMETKKEDNGVFYGTLKVKAGVASVAGNLEKLDIEAFAMTGAGSSLKIPVTDEGQVGRPDFITFTGEDGLSDGPVNTGLQGFDIRMNILATEEADIELIFDDKVGDIIQGRGNGNFSIFINEEGDFSMSGEYEISKGNYLFTSQNILNKKFSVRRGGTIRWNGDPYGAQLDLDAVYSLNADIKDLVQLDRSVRVPVNVIMKMGGSLEKPEIIPGIELPNLDGQDAIRVVSALRAVQYDEQELNKQVFSLMVFNRFAPVGGFLGTDQTDNNGVVSTSISELFTNQLNYWLSRAMNDNLNVAVGTNNLQDVNLLISAKLFNDRVTIERDGALVNAESGVTLGNISVLIKLLPSGQSSTYNRRPSELVLEVFNREKLDVQYNSTNQTGIGVFYKKDFDSLRDLLKGHKE